MKGGEGLTAGGGGWGVSTPKAWRRGGRKGKKKSLFWEERGKEKGEGRSTFEKKRLMEGLRSLAKAAVAIAG